MAREIVHIQIGQCGNRIGDKFFDNISNEHLLNKSEGTYYGNSDDYLYGIKAYYNENTKNKYIPRAVLIGYDPSDLNKVLTGDSPEIYYYGYEYDDKRPSILKDTWAHSYYYDPYEINWTEHINDTIRKESEKCDNLQGFQIVHSCGGGIGSGLSSHIIEKVHDDYPDRTIITHSIFPSQKVTDSILEPYNFILTIPYLLNFADEVICIDNEAVFNIHSQMKIPTPSYGDMNYLISLMMSNFTCPFRFKNQVNSDLNKTVMNLVSYKKLHFIIPSLSTITSRGSTNHYSFTTNQLVSNLFDSKTFLADCDIENSSYLAAFAQFRGNCPLNKIREEFQKIVIPKIRDFKISSCKTSCHYLSKTSSLFCNSTAINEVFGRINSQFQNYYEKRAFVHLYFNEGIEYSDFEQGSQVMNELIDEYKNINDLMHE